MRLVLMAESGTLAGRRFTLDGGSLELGRGDGCDVRFGAGDQQVSRRHAAIAADHGCFRLADHSSNGTLLNGRPVASALLSSGDELQLGSEGPRLRVEILDSAAEMTSDPPRGAPVAFGRRVAQAGLYDPAADKGRRHSAGGLVLLFGMVLTGAFLGLLTALLTVYQLGPGAAFVGVAVAFIPAPVYLATWLWLDRYDPEPAWILAGVFVWGAGAATFVSGIVNSLFQATLFGLTHDRAAAAALSASVSAPVIEELSKGLAVLAVFLLFRREFDGVIDGIVYAGVVALGFAAVENVLYYGRAVAEKGPGLLAVVFVLRGVLGPFSHALFTSMTGIGCGIARQTHKRALRFAMPVVGYGAAVLLHALWNTLASLSGTLGGLLLVYFLIWAPLFLVFFAVVIYMGHQESKLIRRMLQIELARGLLAEEHLTIAGSWPRRIRWLLSDIGRLGARRRFLHAVTRLALCYWHAGRASAAGSHTVSETQLPVFQHEIRTLLGRI